MTSYCFQKIEGVWQALNDRIKRRGFLFFILFIWPIVIIPCLLFGGFILYKSNVIYTSSGWDYEVVDSGFIELSGLTYDQHSHLLVTQEAINGVGSIIQLGAGGLHKVIYSGLDEPDVVRVYDGKIYISEEQGDKGLSYIRNNKKFQLFAADSLEGFDFSDDYRYIYAVEDSKSGRLLRYDQLSGTIKTLAQGLHEAEGVCVGNDGVYYTEKAANTLSRIGFDGGDAEIITKDLELPSALNCDNDSAAVWVAEEKHNLARLLRYDGAKLQVIARFLGEPQEITVTKGGVLIADQRRGTIFKIFQTTADNER